MRLKDKVGLITGSALGFKNGVPSIGSSIALKFASECAKVTVLDINEEMGKKTVEKINEIDDVALFLTIDESSYINE